MANGLTAYSWEEAKETKKRLLAEGWPHVNIQRKGKPGPPEYLVIPTGEKKVFVPAPVPEAMAKAMAEETEFKALEARAKKEPAQESDRERLAREDREALAKEQKELAKEQRATLKAARALEPTVQSIRLPKTPIRLPIQVSAKTAGAIHMKEQRNLKDATHIMDNLTAKYGLTGQESYEQIKGKIMEQAEKSRKETGHNVTEMQDYGKWLKADQIIREGGRLGYGTRGAIAVISRAGEVGIGTAGYLHKEISKSLPGVKHKIDVVAGMKKAIPRAIPGAHTAFGAGSELPPGISQFGAARIAQAPVSRMIGAAPTGAIKAEPTSRITITTEVPKIVAIPKEQGIGFVLGDLGKLREKE